MAHKTLLVTTVKDEGPHILEWVAWHRLCGFDKIMVFQNGSTDLTQRSLKVMHHHGIIEYLRNDGARGSPQVRAYKRAARTQSFQDADWCLTIDGDEFFVSKHGNGTIGDLIDRIEPADSMLINWRNFGSSGHRDMSDDLTSRRFTYTTPVSLAQRQLTGFKTLFRTSAYGRMGIHNARDPRKDTIARVNSSGLPEDQFELLNWRCTDPGGLALAQINHYPIRDASSFILKSLRGRAHQDHISNWDRYWGRFEFNRTQDLTLANRADDILAEMNRLDDISNGRLMLIRKKSQRIWRQNLATALENPDTQAFYDRVISLIDPPKDSA